MLTRGGDRQASRAMWMQIGQNRGKRLASADRPRLRLAQLDALDQIDTLERIVAEFTTRTGRRPQSWEERRRRRTHARHSARSLAARRTRSTPTTGEIGVRRESPLWPLPTEPAAAPELSERGASGTAMSAVLAIYVDDARHWRSAAS